MTSFPTTEHDEHDVHGERDPVDDGASADVAAGLRAAMNRLLAGRPHRTDGWLIKDNPLERPASAAPR